MLCIVNSSKDAREIYRRLPQEGITLHLSRMMCPVHIRETIDIIKKSLASDDAPIIRVVATQLVEAGVDIDFPVVYRQEAGLDSVLQAAGRCNREGRLDMGETHIFSLSEHSLPKGYMQKANQARIDLGDNIDWFAPETMTRYFRNLYSDTSSFDKKDMKHYLYSFREGLCLEEAAKKFHLIEEDGYNVVVRWRDSPKLTAKLEESGPSYSLMKKLGQYMVRVHKSDFETLKQMGVLKEIKDGLYALEYDQQYDASVGLSIDNNWANEVLIK